MGVPGFFLWLCKKARSLKLKGQIIFDKCDQNSTDDEEQKEKINLIDYLLIDANCLIHPMCFKVLAEEGESNWSQSIIERKMINSVLQYIEKLIDFVKPKKGIYIAIDGVAPLAKIKQQRYRRFKSIQDKILFDNIKLKHGKETKKFWNNSAITPGTIFMEKLHSAILKWASKKDTTDVKIIYSSCKTPAEGEHKLLQFIRDNKSKDNIYKYVLYGLDADLIFLALASGNPDIFLLREAQEIDKKKNSNELNYVSIDAMKEFIVQVVSMNTDILNEPEAESIIKKCKENIIRDFIVMCYFLGNDFLPHLSSLNIYTNGIDTIVDKYSELINSRILGNDKINDQKSLNSCFLVKKDGKYFNINEEIFFELVSYLASEEPENLKNDFINKRKKHKCQSTDPYEIEMYRIENLMFNINDPIKLGSDESGLWKKRYYEHHYPTLKESSTEDYQKHIDNMIEGYLEGIKWILKYYFESCPDWKWFYKYNYAPFLEDINEYILRKSYTFKDVKFKKSEPCRPFHQLLMVLPPQASYLLPSKLKGLTTSKDSILVKEGLYPTRVEIDFIGKEKHWMGIPLIPTINYNLIQDVYKEKEKNMIEISKKSGEDSDDVRLELKRNKILNHFVF